MAVLFTLFLCTVNTLNEVSTKSPRPREGATALVRWIELCMFNIVAAMLEFAIILTLDKVQFKKCTSSNGFIAKRQLLLLDTAMLVIFPAVFAIESLIFWSVI